MTTPSSFVVIGLVVLFISGCWTPAAMMPFPFSNTLRAARITAVAVSNVTFLLSVLTSVFSYAGVGEGEKMNKMFLAFFSIGVAALALSVVMFTISQITASWPEVRVYD